VKKTILFLILNFTWVLGAFVMHQAGVPNNLLVFVVVVGAILGNLAVGAGFLAAKRLK